LLAEAPEGCRCAFSALHPPRFGPPNRRLADPACRARVAADHPISPRPARVGYKAVPGLSASTKPQPFPKFLDLPGVRAVETLEFWRIP
jgi:hypothetical protein